MLQDEADEQRLLLAGRGVRGRDAFARMGHGEIGEVRTLERAAGGRVARMRFKFILTMAAYDLVRLPKLLGSPA